MFCIVAYYKDCDDLGDVPENLTHLIVCSIHFAKGFVYLNKYPYDAPQNEIIWQNIQNAYDRGVRISLTIGGAENVFQVLFSDFPKYYNMLNNVITDHPEITSIDLDMEGDIDLLDIQKFIMQLKSDFPSMELTITSTNGELMDPTEPGRGGFCYADLERTMGSHITMYHTFPDIQEELMSSTFQRILLQGFVPQRVCMGINGFQNFKQIQDEIKHMQHICQHSLGGIIVQNYRNRPLEYAEKTHQALVDGKSMCLIM